MNHKYYTTERKKGKHLSYEERVKIETLLERKVTLKEIATIIGVSVRTINREKKRGMVKGLLDTNLKPYDKYSAQKSQRRYDTLQKTKQSNLKIDKNIELANFIEDKILNNKVSPYVALELAKKAGFEVNFCLKTLYNYIVAEIFLILSVKDLPYYRKKNNPRKIIKRIRKAGGRSIEERAEFINNREELGHWEMDTVVGTRESKNCLLVLTERKSRKQIIEKIDAKNSESVIEGIKKIFNRYPKTFKKRFLTITSDNGAEFMNAEAIEELGVTYFYAHSYCSWERGSNENNNKLIRRFISKGTPIENYSKKEIKNIEKWMNNYPRELFHGKTAEEIYQNFFRKIA